MPSAKQEEHTHLIYFSVRRKQYLYHRQRRCAACAGASYRYGKLFKLAGEIKEKTAEEKAAEKQKQEEERAAKTINIKVSDIWEARDYLASNYGISRTKLRSEDAILNAAKEHNINFNME